MCGHIAVIIPTHNRLRRLKACIESLLVSNFPKSDYSIYVVDDGSNDGTGNYLRKKCSEFSNIHMIATPHSGPAKARNEAVKQSSGDLVAFTDDDCSVDKDWLSELARLFKNPSIECVGGKVLSANSCLISKYMDHVCALDPPIDQSGRVRYIVTANACIRRDILEMLGGFNEGFPMAGGEDVELSLRYRSTGSGDIIYSPTCRVYHYYEDSCKDFLRRYYRYGIGCRIGFNHTKNQELWFSNAAGELKRWLMGDIDLRDFVEINGSNNQVWFSLLYQFQRMMLYAGYLHLRTEEQLDQILANDYPWPLKLSTPETKFERKPDKAKTSTIIKKLETGNMFVPVCTEDYETRAAIKWWLSQLNYFHHPRNIENLVKSVVSILDLNSLLEMSFNHKYLPLEPSSPDRDL